MIKVPNVAKGVWIAVKKEFVLDLIIKNISCFTSQQCVWIDGKKIISNLETSATHIQNNNFVVVGEINFWSFTTRRMRIRTADAMFGGAVELGEKFRRRY